jgi:hypothetical protein
MSLKVAFEVILCPDCEGLLQYMGIGDIET